MSTKQSQNEHMDLSMVFNELKKTSGSDTQDQTATVYWLFDEDKVPDTAPEGIKPITPKGLIKKLTEESEDKNKSLILRGNCCDMAMQNALKQIWNEQDVCVDSNFRSLMFRQQEHYFFLTPVLPHEGDTLRKRFAQTIHLITFLQRLTKRNSVQIAILNGCRKEWQGESLFVDRMDFECNMLRENLKRWGEAQEPKIEMSFYEDQDGKTAFEIEDAIIWADIVIAQDGVSGNQYARLLHYLVDDVSIQGIPWFVPKSSSYAPLGEGAFIKDYTEKDGSPEKPLDYQLENMAIWKMLREDNQFSKGE